MHQEPQLAGTRADYDAAQAKARVQAWLETQTEPVTRKAVEEAIEGRAEVVRTALYRLVVDRIVTRTGEGNRWSPYLFACPVSHPIPGHADTLPEMSKEARNDAVLACPIDGDRSGHSAISGTRYFDPDTAARDAMREGA